MDYTQLRRQRRKEARAAQGEDYRLHVQPRLTHFIALQSAVQAWARLAAILLCGAHVGMLALMVAGARPAAGAAGWFIVGLIAAAIVVLGGFLNAFFQSRLMYGRVGQQLYVGEALSYDSDWPLRYIDDPRDRDFKGKIELKITFLVSVIAGIVSAACLVIGFLRLMG